MTLVALSLLGAATVLFVLTPVFRPDTVADAPWLDAAGRELQDLEEKKLRLYASIKDLDFERDAGKVSAADYDHARADYIGQVAEVLARIEVLNPSSRTPEKKRTALPSKGAAPSPTATDGETRPCGGCHTANPAGAKFCMGCGRPLAATCSSCGTTLPLEAKFCSSCGRKVPS